ncbi:MAG TPA: chromosome segregation protein SMC [Saprospiraceae bacterium]|nr:chromosome segregation protein SMC [Saprospiraceae bacterium]
MRLKSLEIKGFKSFADETVIHFNESITGIVGPNGSGKSNIVDAIRWVLGEQKGRELRLAQMSDVIFNGTKKRKAAPLSQVTLNFENHKSILQTEYQNIAISRLLYRSGESEYRLNGVTCRLKDITSLFLDTGIGSDSYAIIALGMVEDILSNKENARRKMFEQAAGVSKYKARKRESINKLKATNEDMARIEDLLFEINNNLVELEKQAKRAKKFFEMKVKYKSTALLLYHISVESLKVKIEEITKRIETESLKIGDEEASLTKTEAELEHYKLNHLHQEKSLGEFQKKVNDILDKIRVLESDIQVKEQKRIMLDTQLLQLDKQVQNATVKKDSLDKELLSINTELESSDVEMLLIQELLVEKEKDFLEKQTKFESLKSGVDQYSNQRQIQEKEIFDIEKNLAIFQNQIENLESENKRSSQEIHDKSNEFLLIQTHVDDVDTNLSKIQGELKFLTESEEERIAKLKEMQSAIDTQTQSLALKNRTKDAKKNEFELLKSMVEKMEGFPESIQFLNQNWRKDVPVLSDLIYTEEKYRNSIELFLEAYLNFYVVHTEEEAVHAIRMLYSNGKGKANFFILNKFSNEQFPSKDLGSCVRAIDVIEADAAYIPLFNHLLKDVYILESDRHIEDVIKFSDEQTVISLSGSILKRNKTITGGSVGLFEGKKLGRKKNLEKLESEIKALDIQIIDAERVLSNLKAEFKKVELLNKNNEIAIIRKKETELIAQKAQLSAKMQHYNEAKAKFEEQSSRNNSRILEIKSTQEEKLNLLQKRKAELEEVLKVIAATDDVFGQSSGELAVASNNFNLCKLDNLKVQNKNDNLRKDLNFKQNQFNELEIQINSDSQKIEHYQVEIEALKNGLQELKADVEEKYQFRKGMESDLSSLESQYYDARNEMTIYETKIRGHQKAILELQSSVNTLKDQKSEFKYKIQSAYEKADIEFQTSLDGFVPDEETVDMNEDQLRERANYYKVRLDNYGEINPLALEAYEEMKERHDKIQEQRADIIAAQESLLATIKEIEETATAGFMLAFNQVRAHFQDVFRSLFTLDDDCDLILMNENDPLECDIDIIAKPKGKRPKSIHQLSGGEKTLTAIALLFSLYLLKPAPFCIFDEVDAPLDDTNIEKFNTIIRKFSKDSQFIIITHNKLTMAEVDILYGVYMEEQGISNVTAVDFRKYEHEMVMEEIEG